MTKYDIDDQNIEYVSDTLANSQRIHLYHDRDPTTPIQCIKYWPLVVTLDDAGWYGTLMILTGTV